MLLVIGIVAEMHKANTSRSRLQIALFAQSILSALANWTRSWLNERAKCNKLNNSWRNGIVLGLVWSLHFPIFILWIFVTTPSGV